MTNILITFKNISLPVLLFLLTSLFSNCGNTSEKQSSPEIDSIIAIEQWNETIPGNFSEEQVFHFDSAQITEFLKEHPELKSHDSNMTRFYKNREYAYAWFDGQGLIEQAGNLIDRVSNLKEEGLFIKPHYKEKLEALILKQQYESDYLKPDLNFELMLTAQYFDFAEKVWQGMDQKSSEESAWFLPRKKTNYKDFLDSLLASPADNAKILREPIYRQYELLKKSLLTYRELANTLAWEPIDLDQNVYEEGDTSISIPKIKARLYYLGDFKGDTSSLIFDEELTDVAKNFQSRHGIAVDGVIGPGTVRELNVTPEARTRQLIVNMERSRWVPLSLNKEYLAVNIPEFKLHIYNGDSLLWSTNVVVGTAIHKTVVFSGDIKYVVFSPYWNIPNSIVRNEVMPAMARNSNYLRRNNMEITGYRGNIPIVRQKPGPTNSLGLVKFIFPNSYNIYLHDSPAKSLFDQNARAFSHGCIRVQEPARLADFLLKTDSNWNDESIKKAMNLGREKTVTLKDPIPVFISYFTAFVDRDGIINFRKDIYNRDERLAKMIIEE